MYLTHHIETHYPLYPMYLGTGFYRAKYVFIWSRARDSNPEQLDTHSDLHGGEALSLLLYKVTHFRILRQAINPFGHTM